MHKMFKVKGPQWLCYLGLIGLLFGKAPSSLHAQAPASEEETPPFQVMVPKTTQDAVAKTFGALMKLNGKTAQAFQLAKAAVQLDPFAVVDVLIGLLAEEGSLPEVTVRQARDEILSELAKTREQQFEGRANGLLSIFEQLVQDPRNMLADERLALYLNDATSLHQELQVIMRDRTPERAETIAHLVPVYNTVTSSLVVGLTMADWAPESINQVYLDAIETNRALVSDEDNYGGSLYRHVVKTYGSYTCCRMPEGCNQCGLDPAGNWAGCALGFADTGFYPRCAGSTIGESLVIEEHRRMDTDPTVFLIRQTVAEQRLALTTPSP